MGFKFKLNNSGRYLYSLPGNGHFNIILLHFQTNCYSISQLVLELQAKDEFIFLTMHSRGFFDFLLFIYSNKDIRVLFFSSKAEIQDFLAFGPCSFNKMEMKQTVLLQCKKRWGTNRLKLSQVNQASPISGACCALATDLFPGQVPDGAEA